MPLKIPHLCASVLASNGCDTGTQHCCGDYACKIGIPINLVVETITPDYFE